MSHTFKDRLQVTLQWRGQLSWQGMGKIDWLESRCERILLFLSLHRDNRPDERRLLRLATNTLMTLAWVLYGFFFFLFFPSLFGTVQKKIRNKVLLFIVTFAFPSDQVKSLCDPALDYVTSAWLVTRARRATLRQTTLMQLSLSGFALKTIWA